VYLRESLGSFKSWNFWFLFVKNERHFGEFKEKAKRLGIV